MRTAIQNIKSSKSTDYYGINSLMLKKVVNLIITPMTNLFNRCVTLNTFPDVLKIACVVPIHKKGNVDSATNYRPISLLPVVGKVFERLLGAQLVEHLEGYQHLEVGQHGFRASKSAGTALCALVDKIVDCYEGHEYCEVSFLDLSKAFDTVSHEL